MNDYSDGETLDEGGDGLDLEDSDTDDVVGSSRGGRLGKTYMFSIVSLKQLSCLVHPLTVLLYCNGF